MGKKCICFWHCSCRVRQHRRGPEISWHRYLCAAGGVRSIHWLLVVSGGGAKYVHEIWGPGNSQVVLVFGEELKVPLSRTSYSKQSLVLGGTSQGFCCPISFLKNWKMPVVVKWELEIRAFCPQVYNLGISGAKERDELLGSGMSKFSANLSLRIRTKSELWHPQKEMRQESRLRFKKALKYLRTV